MPFSLSCPACGARLKAPDAAAGRTLRCPKCGGPVAVPAADDRSAAFAFATPLGRGYSDDEGNPFDDDGPAGESEIGDPDPKPKNRRTTAKRKPAGFNPFAGGGGDEESKEADPPKKRRYRKDGDYNPFGDAEADEEPDPAGDGFDFGVESPPPPAAGDFDFGPLDPRGDDDRRRQ